MRKTRKPKLFIGLDTHNLHLFVSSCCKAYLSYEPLCKVVCGECEKQINQNKAIYHETQR